MLVAHVILYDGMRYFYLSEELSRVVVKVKLRHVRVHNLDRYMTRMRHDRVHILDTYLSKLNLHFEHPYSIRVYLLGLVKIRPTYC
ncbi:MAG: hypothetical protein ACRCR3_03190 [Tannerellaceae bacterium]